MNIYSKKYVSSRWWHTQPTSGRVCNPGLVDRELTGRMPAMTDWCLDSRCTDLVDDQSTRWVDGRIKQWWGVHSCRTPHPIYPGKCQLGCEATCRQSVLQAWRGLATQYRCMGAEWVSEWVRFFFTTGKKIPPNFFGFNCFHQIFPPQNLSAQLFSALNHPGN